MGIQKVQKALESIFLSSSFPDLTARATQLCRYLVFSLCKENKSWIDFDFFHLHTLGKNDAYKHVRGCVIVRGIVVGSSGLPTVRNLAGYLHKNV